jgi:hypothetical protein
MLKIIKWSRVGEEDTLPVYKIEGELIYEGLFSIEKSVEFIAVGRLGDWWFDSGKKIDENWSKQFDAFIVREYGNQPFKYDRFV